MRTSLGRLALLLGGVVLLGQGCAQVTLPSGKSPPLTVWGAFDDVETMKELTDAFRESQRGSKGAVEYKKVSPSDQYEEILRTALAEGRGPDVFLLHASWVPRWIGSISPAPAELLPVRAVREEFADTVANDLVVDGRLVGLPLFVDSLALYYNKDIFNAAGISLPPRTWTDVYDVVKRTTKFNSVETSQIDQHGITLGSGRNVNRSPDVLSVLMMQNGAPMLDERGEIGFGHHAGAQTALGFLTSFANSSKDVYTWALSSDYSVDAFAEGEAAMMVNYSHHLPTIRLKNPRLRFAVAPLPQLEGTDEKDFLTYASYWALAVSRQTPNAEAAWEFVRFATAHDQAKGYLVKSGYPPARNDLIEELKDDPRIGVFAEQALIARTWRQPDNRVVDRVFTEILDDVVAGRDTAEGALRRAAEQIQAAADALRQGTASQGLRTVP